MARKPETGAETFIDMFRRFGEGLPMPDVDVDRIIDHHRRNLEALEKSARASQAGASAILSRQREMLQETLGEITELAQSYRSPENPQELIAKQADFARRSFETAVKNAGEMAELMSRSGGEAVDILRARIREGMEEIKQGYEKQK